MKIRGLTNMVIACSISAVVLGLGIYELSNNFLNSAEKTQAHRCDGNYTHHTVKILNTMVMPHHTQAKQCDTLTITNLETTEHLLAFGPHDHHISYDGVSERLLSKGQSINITLNRTGTFVFHDHLDDAHIYGTFTVTK